MFKKILTRVSMLLMLILSILIVLSIYESNHTLDNYESMVGKNILADTMEYEVTDRSSHLGYLETFNWQGYKMRYLDRGSRTGKVIVLLHGTPTNSWLWRKIVPGLIDAGYRVIAPDMLGFGASDMPTHTADIATERQSQLLLALLDELGVNTFSIAGHDQGSLWTRETITTIPERIENLIIFNSIGDRAGFHPPAGFGEKNMSTMFTAWAMGSKPLGRIFAYGAMLGGLKNKRQATTTMVDGYLFPLMHGMSTTYEAFITDFATIEADLALAQIEFPQLDIPTLVLRGKHDKILVGEEQVPVLQKLLDIKDEDIHFLDAAHFVQEEVPDEIVEQIINFVN